MGAKKKKAYFNNSYSTITESAAESLSFFSNLHGYIWYLAASTYITRYINEHSVASEKMFDLDMHKSDYPWGKAAKTPTIRSAQWSYTRWL